MLINPTVFQNADTQCAQPADSCSVPSVLRAAVPTTGARAGGSHQAATGAAFSAVHAASLPAASHAPATAVSANTQ